jgi:hypothetical protein
MFSSVCRINLHCLALCSPTSQNDGAAVGKFDNLLSIVYRAFDSDHGGNQLSEIGNLHSAEHRICKTWRKGDWVRPLTTVNHPAYRVKQMTVRRVCKVVRPENFNSIFIDTVVGENCAKQGVLCLK